MRYIFVAYVNRYNVWSIHVISDVALVAMFVLVSLVSVLARPVLCFVSVFTFRSRLILSLLNGDWFSGQIRHI